MSKSTNTVVYFDWKTVIYIYVCGKCRTQFMLPMEKSVTFTGACANEITPSINRSFVYKAKEGCYVRMIYKCVLCKISSYIEIDVLINTESDITDQQKQTVVFDRFRG